MKATRTHQAIPVIFHFGGQSHKIQETPLLREAYLTEINQLVHQYPDVLFYLENVTIVSVLQQKNKIHFRDASVETVPEFVSWLREALNLPHLFYSVLDTCHAIMVCRWLNTVGLDCQLESFFKAHEKTCGLIHLVNANRFGFFEDHGTSFLAQDQSLLNEIMRYYATYQYICPITIEVTEKDFFKYDRYQQTMETLNQIKKV